MTTGYTEPSPLVVLHIISGLGQGGAETVLYRLITSDTSATQHVVVSLGDEGVFGPRFQQASIPVHCLHMKGMGFLSGWLSLRRLLKHIRPDAVQTWMYHADLIGGLAARSVGIKSIAWGIRNSGENLHQSSWAARIMASVSAKLSRWIPRRIVACAENAARRHKQWGYDSSKMVVIPNGYNLSQWQPQPELAQQFRQQLGVASDTALLAMVGRWNPLKDHPNLLAALAKLKRSDAAYYATWSTRSRGLIRTA